MFLLIINDVHAIDSKHDTLNPNAFEIHKDTTIKSLIDVLEHGHVGGHIRAFTMATINDGDLRDYWTQAIGGALHFETADWRGIQFGVKGIFSYNVLGNDLNKVDTLVGSSAKWEKELYDVMRPGEKHDLDRLEELYFKYSIGSSYFIYGKIDINEGPLFLRRDGRMKPFVYRGAWLDLNELSGHRFQLGYINGVSPRGFTEWLDLDEVIGIANNGCQPDGSDANYHNSQNIKAIYAFGYENGQLEDLNIQAWNYLFQRQSDITWLQLDYKKKNLVAGIQYAHQMSLPEQADLDYDERYMQPDEEANVLSMMLGFEKKTPKGELQLRTAFLKAFDTGRFLFPRELGREDFYASQPRSWIDGWGDTEVYMVKMKYETRVMKTGKFSLEADLSRTVAPDLERTEFNKYGLTSFYQTNIYPKFHFRGTLEGLDVGLLYIAKYTEDEIDLSPQQTFYRTNLHHFNLIANINF